MGFGVVTTAARPADDTAEEGSVAAVSDDSGSDAMGSFARETTGTSVEFLTGAIVVVGLVAF